MNENSRSNGHTQQFPRVSPPLADGDTTDRFATDYSSAGLLHLLVGAALFGADELRDWLRGPGYPTDGAKPPPFSVQAEQPRSAPSDAFGDAFGDALVGLLFETESTMRRGLSSALARAARFAHEADAWYSRFTREMYQTPLDPPLERFDDLLSRFTEQVDRWSDRGWREQRQSRRVAERAFTETMDELLAYMARNPEVRKLIEQQGMDMAESAADTARARAEAADQWVERLAHGLLHRKPNGSAAEPHE